MDKEQIDFNPVAILFNKFIFYCVMGGIMLLIVLLILNLINFFTIVYYILSDIINLIFNNNYIYSNSFQLSLMDCIKCTKDDYSKDKLYIYLEEKYTLTIFNILFYIVFLILFPFIIYGMYFVYSYFKEEKLIGSISFETSSIIILVFLIIFCIIHIGFYILFFQNNIISYYININNKSNNLDKDIKTALYHAINPNNLIISLYIDKTPLDIEEFNNVLYENIKNQEICTSLLLSYNIYKYFNVYISVSDDNYSNLISYINCIDNNNISFISLLNMQDVNIMNKYYEELDIFNKTDNMPKDNLNNLYKSLNNTNAIIDKINNFILINNNLNLPSYLILLYIIIIIFLTVGVLVIILLIIKTSKSKNYEDLKYIIDYIINFYQKIMKI